MKCKLIVVSVVIVSLLTLLAVPAFATEATTSAPEPVVDWSYSYATGFPNGVSSAASSSPAVPFGGLISTGGFYVSTANSYFRPATGVLNIALSRNYTNSSGYYYIFLRGLVIDNLASSGLVEVSASDVPLTSGVYRFSAGSSNYVDVESLPDDVFIYRGFWGSGTSYGTNVYLHVSPVIPSSEVDLDSTFGFVSTMTSFFVEIGQILINFITDSWICLLPLVLWLLAAVIGCIRKFLGKEV